MNNIEIEKGISVWVGNLAAYLGGIIEGENLSLPMKKEEFKSAISSISKGGKHGLYIDPVKSKMPEKLNFFINRIADYSNPRQLNAIAWLCCAQDLNFEVINAFVDYRRVFSLQEVGNVLLQADKIPFPFSTRREMENLQLDKYNWEDIYKVANLMESTLEVSKENNKKQRIEKTNAGMPMASQDEMRRLFVDMDGTLAVFKPTDTLEVLYEKNYFKNLEPMPEMLRAIKKIIREEPEIEVYILSAHLGDSPYALEEKNQWLDRYLPEIPLSRRIFPACGEDKKTHIPGGIRETDFLLDDYTKNLAMWQPPGKGIKLLNGINHTRGSWGHDRIWHQKPSQDLARDIVDVVKGNRSVLDKAACAETLKEHPKNVRSLRI